MLQLLATFLHYMTLQDNSMLVLIISMGISVIGATLITFLTHWFEYKKIKKRLDGV